MKVSDVMSRHVEIVSPHERVEKAALLIFGRNINGVPVCIGKKIVGVISEKDILSKFFPSYGEYIDDTVHSSNFEEMEEKAAAILSLPVEKIMHINPTTVSPETPVLKAHSLMATKEIGRLPVVDNTGHLLGIVSKGDVFRSLIGDKLLFTENEDYTDFLSKTYYATVDWKNRIKNELPDLIKLLAKHKAKTVLDVGCGTGDYSIELARRGYNVVGTDRSREMIKEANRRKTALSANLSKNVNFIYGDTENILFDLNISFDAVLFMGNTLSHNPYNYKRLVRKTSNALSEKGVMVIQITNFEKVFKVKNRLLNFNFAKPQDEINKEYAFIEYYDPPTNQGKTVLKTFAILSSDYKRWKWSGIRNTLLVNATEERIKGLLQECGLSNVSSYGSSFDGRKWDYLLKKPYSPLESDWLNMVATRK